MEGGLQPEKAAGIGLAILVGALSLFAAQVLSNTQNMMGLAITLGLILFMIVFVWPEVGLYVLLLSMLLGPEIIVGDLAGGTTATSRGVTLRVDDFLLLVIMFTWLARGAVHKEIGLFVRSRLNRPIGVFLAIAAVSTAVGMLFDRVRPVVGFFYVLKMIEYVIVYFAAVNYIQSKSQLRRLVGIAFFTAIAVSFIGMAQIPQGVRVSAPFEGDAGEPNTFGGYLLFMLSIFGGLMVSAPDLKTASKYVAGLVILGIPFMYTLSRASYLGLIFAAPTIVYFSRQKAISGFATLAAMLALFLIAPPEMVERIQYTFGGQGARSDQIVVGNVRLDTSTTARIESYGNIMEDFPDHPLIGHGVTGYGFVDGQFPRVLIEMGLFGMAAFLWLLFRLLQEGRSALAASTGWWERGIAIGYLAGLAGLIAHAFGSNTFLIVRIMEPFWFFTGVMTLLVVLNMKEAAEEPAREAAQPIGTGLLRPWSG